MTRLPIIPTIPQVRIPDTISQELLDSMAEANAFNRGFAEVLFKKLMREVYEFENSLNPDEEIGAHLASFGAQVVVHIEKITYQDPYFIIFDGTNTTDGEKVRLVQHVSQINVLFVAIKLQDNSKPAKRIGFVLEETQKQDSQENPKSER